MVQALLAEDLPANTAYINNCFPTQVLLFLLLLLLFLLLPFLLLCSSNCSPQPSATAASPGVQEELWEAAVATLELRMGEGCCTEPL